MVFHSDVSMFYFSPIPEAASQIPMQAWWFLWTLAQINVNSNEFICFSAVNDFISVIKEAQYYSEGKRET